MNLRDLKKYILPFTLMAIIGFLIIAACGGAGGTTEAGVGKCIARAALAVGQTAHGCGASLRRS